MTKQILYRLLAALSLVFVSAAYCEEYKAWDLDAMIHQDLKQDFLKTPQEFVSYENLENLRKLFTPPQNFHKEDPAVEFKMETIGDNLKILVYKPAGVTGKLPAVLWIHAGGHIIGGSELDDEILASITKRAQCIVLALEYRLAPEFPYPADLDDCMTALKWLADNPDVNADKIAVAGQSAGGGLTAALTLKARDEGGPAICFQMPLYPMLDCRNITPSSYQIRDKRVWHREANLVAWEMYLNGKSPDIYASPALAEDLANLPPAYIMVGTLDPFRDEAVTYAQRLMQAGVPVELHVIPGVTHAFETIYTDVTVSIKASEEYINALANALK